MADSDPPDSAAGGAQMLLRSIDFFEFILCMEITTPIFNETAIASVKLQRKNFDLTASYTIAVGVIQRVKALRMEAAGTEVPKEIPGQARHRNVPQKYKYSSKSVTKEYQIQDSLPSLTSCPMLHRRFKEKNDTPTGSILSGLHCLTVSRHWKGKLDDKAAASINNMCQFYDVEEENIITELKVFHSSYALLSNNITAALKCLGENDVESVFPSVTMLLKMYATIPMTTASLEQSFSKLNLIKTVLRNRCGEKRLSDLMLLSIERDIPIDQNKVIDIYKQMAKRRISL